MAFLSTAKTDKLIDARLKLRNEIRKLINRIDVYPAGNPYFTIKTAKKALKDVSMTISKDKDPKGYAWIKEELRRRVESPRDFRCFSIKFKSGSFRTIDPQRKLPLRLDFDKEERVLRIWNKMPNGRIMCEEFLEDGIKVRHYRRSMGPDNEEILQEILDSDSEEDNRLAKEAFRVIKRI